MQTSQYHRLGIPKSSWVHEEVINSLSVDANIFIRITNLLKKEPPKKVKKKIIELHVSNHEYTHALLLSQVPQMVHARQHGSQLLHRCTKAHVEMAYIVWSLMSSVMAHCSQCLTKIILSLSGVWQKRIWSRTTYRLWMISSTKKNSRKKSEKFCSQRYSISVFWSELTFCVLPKIQPKNISCYYIHKSKQKISQLTPEKNIKSDNWY